MYSIYFYDCDNNVIKHINYDDKEKALTDYNAFITRFKCPNFYGKMSGKKVKFIEYTVNGIPYDFVEF